TLRCGSDGSRQEWSRTRTLPKSRTPVGDERTGAGDVGCTFTSQPARRSAFRAPPPAAFLLPAELVEAHEVAQQPLVLASDALHLLGELTTLLLHDDLVLGGIRVVGGTASPV